MKCSTGLSILLSLIIFFVSAGGCSKKKKVLAVVGGRKITTTDFDRAILNLPENYKVLAESYKGKHKILDNLIKKELLVIEAEKRKYPRDANLKKRIKESRARMNKELDSRIAELQEQLGYVEQQVYENALLNELNARLKQEGLEGVEITKAEIAEYYADYARKLKILNPAAKVPKQAAVAKQIRAILIEERLIKQLEKQRPVEIKEILFRELYGDERKDIVIEDATGN